MATTSTVLLCFKTQVSAVWRPQLIIKAPTHDSKSRIHHRAIEVLVLLIFLCSNRSISTSKIRFRSNSSMYLRRHKYSIEIKHLWIVSTTSKNSSSTTGRNHEHLTFNVSSSHHSTIINRFNRTTPTTIVSAKSFAANQTLCPYSATKTIEILASSFKYFRNPFCPYSDTKLFFLGAKSWVF